MNWFKFDRNLFRSRTRIRPRIRANRGKTFEHVKWRYNHVLSCRIHNCKDLVIFFKSRKATDSVKRNARSNLGIFCNNELETTQVGEQGHSPWFTLMLLHIKTDWFCQIEIIGRMDWQHWRHNTKTNELVMLFVLWARTLIGQTLFWAHGGGLWRWAAVFKTSLC